MYLVCSCQKVAIYVLGELYRGNAPNSWRRSACEGVGSGMLRGAVDALLEHFLNLEKLPETYNFEISKYSPF